MQLVDVEVHQAQYPMPPVLSSIPKHWADMDGDSVRKVAGLAVDNHGTQCSAGISPHRAQCRSTHELEGDLCFPSDCIVTQQAKLVPNEMKTTQQLATETFDPATSAMHLNACQVCPCLAVH